MLVDVRLTQLFLVVPFHVKRLKLNRLGQSLAMAAVALWLAGCVTTTGPLAALPGPTPLASQQNLEGIELYRQERWLEAKTHFESAVEADPTMAEAHFNLALTLHRLGQHQDAATHFAIAGQLAPRTRDIVESTLYRNHLGLSSTLERHFSGGYRY